MAAHSCTQNTAEHEHGCTQDICTQLHAENGCTQNTAARRILHADCTQRTAARRIPEHSCTQNTAARRTRLHAGSARSCTQRTAARRTQLHAGSCTQTARRERLHAGSLNTAARRERCTQPCSAVFVFSCVRVQAVFCQPSLGSKYHKSADTRHRLEIAIRYEINQDGSGY